MTPALSMRAARRSPASLFAAEPRFAAAGALIALSLVVTLAAMALDPRLFQDENVWVKPVKFQIALALYLPTLALFARWLPAGMTGRRSYRVYAGLVVFAVIAELVWIGGAAMAGTASHFNTQPAMAALYAVMGALAVLLTSASLVYGIAIWRNPHTGLPPALKLAIALGLVLTFVLTVPIAGTMSQGEGHFVGTPITGATLPLFGWSREVGDLRAPHFFATHAMHAIPVLALAAVALLPARAAVPAAWSAAALYVALVLASFWGALAGRPLIPLA
jgi:hypothetical protein